MRSKNQTIHSAVILNCSSIGYPAVSGLALGSTNPGSILVAQETLDFRRSGFSPEFLLLMPAFLLPCAPPRLTPMASAHKEHSSTIHTANFILQFSLIAMLFAKGI
jgi:hypothetical protein